MNKFRAHETISRRRFLASAAIAGATISLAREPAAASVGVKRTFNILHANNLHSNLIGPVRASEYSPFNLNDDKMRGGFRLYLTPR